MSNKKPEIPSEYKDIILDLEARLDENKKVARLKNPENYKRKTPELDHMYIFAKCDAPIIEYFMKSLHLITLNDIGEFVGRTRQRVERLLNHDRKDIDLKSIKLSVMQYLNPPKFPEDIEDLPDEEWKQITEIDGIKTAKGYAISNKGRVCVSRDVTKLEITKSIRKLIMCKPDKNGRIRVNIKFTEGDTSRRHFYVNTLMGRFWVVNKKPKEYNVVSYRNPEKMDDNSVDNLYWEAKSTSLLRSRAQDDS